MKNLRIAVLLSGGGTTLENLLRWKKEEKLAADIRLVVSSREGVRGLEVARKAGIPTEVVPSRNYRVYAREAEMIVNWEAMSADLNAVLLPREFDLVCLCGFMCRYVIPAPLDGKVINIHPALIPAFCGQGMYGHLVHEAVAASGVRVTGCTVHFCDNKYDSGPIILQRCCPVFSGDTADHIQARVFEQECIAYPTAINLIAEGKVKIIDGRVFVDGDRTLERFVPNVT